MKKLKVIIAGGTGFIGDALENHFINHQHSVFILTRHPKKSNHIYWDGFTLGHWKNNILDADVLINLCGKSVDCRYTSKNKLDIVNSRIQPTLILQKAVDMIDNPTLVWINASSATIYEDSRIKKMTEFSGDIGNDFSMNVCKRWEEVFFNKRDEGVRKVAVRLSIVLGKNGGAFPKLELVTKIGFGGRQGKGDQLCSWVHVDDVCRAIGFIIMNDALEGPVNVTSPMPIQNVKLMSALRFALNIRLGISQPVPILEFGAFLIRTETELLLKSRNVIPQKLEDAGFKFNYKDIDSALSDIINSTRIANQGKIKNEDLKCLRPSY